MVAIVSDGVVSGYGEATANPYYHSTQKRIGAGLDKLKPFFQNMELQHPEEVWAEMHRLLPDDSFALCAADVAYWDYYARKKGVALRRLFADDVKPLPLTSYTIGLASVAQMKRKLLEMPWPVYKIKLGRPNDLDIVRELRQLTESVFRVDANAAWTPAQAVADSVVLKDLGVEFIEQPLPAQEVEAMKQVFEKAVLPCLADESCQVESDVLRCSGQFHGINIKLMKCGGITPALRMIAQARALGLRVMAGCMTESTVGISALVQLAPLLDYLDADGALLLARDIASGVSFSEGKIIFSENVGTGVELHRF